MNKKFEEIMFIIILILLSFVMIYWVNQKEGFHEDEIFSFGSSNYKYDNVYQRYGLKDAINTIIYDEILNNNLKESIHLIKYYLQNTEEFEKRKEEIETLQNPIWKTNDDVKNYLTIEKDDILNIFSIWYNQSRDVHPPLFYLLVHIFCSISLETFSKYNIFFINLIFFILTCVYMRKILMLINKNNFSIPLILLYGLSIGNISNVIFLRMYQMLTFFTVVSLYLNLYIIKNELYIDKKTSVKLIIITILGFLTHYYYCIFALIEFLVMLVFFIKNKNYSSMKIYIKDIIISAILGVLIFPASIYHIFFSYRGLNAELNDSFLERILTNCNEISNAFSMPMWLLISLVLFILAIYFYNIKKENNKCQKQIYLLIIISPLLYFSMVSLIAPASLRYMFPILPIFSIIMIIALIQMLSKLKKERSLLTITYIIVFIVSGYGLLTNKPQFLYKGYNEMLKIAEEYQDTDYIYVSDNNFTYLSNLPEMYIYKKSMIVNWNEDSHEKILYNIELENSQNTIVSLRKWMDYENIINYIIEHTHFDNYSILKDSKEMDTIVYKLGVN